MEQFIVLYDECGHSFVVESLDEVKAEIKNLIDDEYHLDDIHVYKVDKELEIKLEVVIK